MPLRVNDATVIHSFSDTVPHAAAHAETYLRTVARGVQAAEPPVTLALDTLSTGGLRGVSVNCLVVEPTSQRLRHYRTAHFAKPSGGNLSLGWYLLGGERAGGRQIGIFNVGAVSDLEVDEVMSITEVVHTYAVLPAVQELVDLVQRGSAPPGGFLGV
jgi:hypothetical protein